VEIKLVDVSGLMLELDVSSTSISEIQLGALKRFEKESMNVEMTIDAMRVSNGIKSWQREQLKK